MFEVVFDYGEGHYREEAPDAEGRILSYATMLANADWPDTYRLCRRVLMFHHFPDELGTDPCLVRSTALHYEERSADRSCNPRTGLVSSSRP
jgi:hypothetical protein